MSLLIGAIAGVLGAISLNVPLGDKPIETATIIALLGIGYSGADFIEAFMARYSKPGGDAAGAANAAGGAPGPAPAAGAAGVGASGATADDAGAKAVG